MTEPYFHFWKPLPLISYISIVIALSSITTQLDGQWYSKIGSYMIFKTDPNGNITGTYHTAVGKMTGELRGRYDVNGGKSFGWNATWPIDPPKYPTNSSTSWVADLDTTTMTILSTWMIREELYGQTNFASTVSGCEEYSKIKPSDDEMQKELLKRRRQPHPTSE